MSEALNLYQVSTRHAHPELLDLYARTIAINQEGTEAARDEVEEIIKSLRPRRDIYKLV